MHNQYVIALDQGTTSSRAMLIDAQGRAVSSVQRPFPQIYPHPGWVEHNPQDILSSQLEALTACLVSNSLTPADIDSIGITNQRETTVLWDNETGAPGLQRHRLAVPPHGGPSCDELRRRHGPRGRTSARPRASCPTPTSPATKIKWILDHVPEGTGAGPARESSLFGTVDSWLDLEADRAGKVARHRRTRTPPAPCSTTSTRLDWDRQAARGASDIPAPCMRRR